MKTKLYILLFTLLAVLVSCERTDPQEEVSYAIVSGKKVKSVERWFFDNDDELENRYVYEYNESGEVSKLTDFQNGREDLRREYLFTFEGDEVISVDDGTNRWEYFYDNKGLVEKCVKKFSDFGPLLSYVFFWNGNHVTGCEIYDMEEMLLDLNFEWQRGDLITIDNFHQRYENIIDNFKVPFPCYHDRLILASSNEFLIWNIFKSEHLVSETVSTSRVVGYTYERNSEGDICRINVGEYMYYLIEYYD